MNLSVDEQRIAAWLHGVAANFEKRAEGRPFSFDRMKAKLLRDMAAAIEQGRHR